MNKKIAVFSSTRAEYGLLRRLIINIERSSIVTLQLIVSGTHQAENQGMTIDEISNDGIRPTESINIDLNDDSPEGVCHSMGLALSRFSQKLSKLKPDILLLLGDRYETLCCAAAAQIHRIPIAHIHGGERTEGLIDEAFRHSITKMAHLHFPCCEEYRQRIIQLGESPNRVFNVGSLGVENIRKMKQLAREELETSVGFKLDRPFFLITFHPVTLEKSTAGKQFSELLAALDKFPDHKCIFTGANADTDGKIIDRIMSDYVTAYPGRCIATPSLGWLRYLSAMKFCDVVIGNSSSGILEAPVFRVPTVNIGDRQKGRIRPKSVIDCAPDKDSIQEAILKALSTDFKDAIIDLVNPFEIEGSSNLIIEKLLTTDWDNLLKKRFFDLNIVNYGF